MPLEIKQYQPTPRIAPDRLKDKATARISVIIPAFNEERSIAHVISDLPRDIVRDIIVVDNGSTDRTAAIAEGLGCRVVYEAKRGYGAACLAGVKALDPDTEIVVFLDGDHSDHAEQLQTLVQPILLSGCDLVIGSRALGKREKGAMAPQAFYGNKLACFLMRLFWGVRYTDLGPFRAIKYEALKRLNMRDADYGWTVEMQIRAVERDMTIMEVPVDYRRRIGKSKISGTIKGTILAGRKILSTIVRYKFLERRDYMDHVPVANATIVKTGAACALLWGFVTAMTFGLPERVGALLNRLTLGYFAEPIAELANGFYYDVSNNDMPTGIFLGVFAVIFTLVMALTAKIQRRPTSQKALGFIIFFSVLFRLILLPGELIHENDIYRYLWDGKAALAGVNPYKYAPMDISLYDYMNGGEVSAEYRDMFGQYDISDRVFAGHDPRDLDALSRARAGNRVFYDRIGHWTVPTVYPPVAQAFFALPALVNWHSLLLMKAVFVAFDIATLFLIIGLLNHFGRNPCMSLVYGWSPLVAFSIANGGHYDSIAVFFTMLGVTLFIKEGRRARGMVALALATLSKLFSGVLVPVLLKPVRFRLVALFGLVIALCYAPFFLWDGMGVKGVFEGLHTYNQQWSYNASIFAVVYHALARLPVEAAHGLMPAKIAVGCLYLLILTALVIRKDRGPLDRLHNCFLAVAWLFLVNPVADPWYFCWVVPFLCFFPYRSWLLLSGLLMLSYLNFHTDIGWLDATFLNIPVIGWLTYAPFFTVLLGERLAGPQFVPGYNRLRQA